MKVFKFLAVLLLPKAIDVDAVALFNALVAICTKLAASAKGADKKLKTSKIITLNTMGEGRRLKAAAWVK